MKVLIRPLKQLPHPPADFEERSWDTLQAALRAVFAKAPLPGSGSREELYRLVQALCFNGSYARLTHLLQQELDGHISAKLSELRAAVTGAGASDGDAALLPLVQAAWHDHCEAMRSVSAIFTHLDRTHILAQEGAAVAAPAPGGAGGGARSLRVCSTQLFRSKLDAMPEVRDRVLQGVLRLVDSDRGPATWPAAAAAPPQPQAQALLESLVAMFASLDLYASLLEPALLAATACFYRAEAEALLPRSSAVEYLEHCERRLDEEQRRCEACLVHSSAPSLLGAARDELLRKPCARVLDGGFSDLVSGHRVRDLVRLYRLFAQVDELSSVRRAWVQAIRDAGVSIMAQAEDCDLCKTVVHALVGLHERLCEIHRAAFMSSADFGIALKDAFEGFLNSGTQQNLPAKLLARHFDEAMRNERPGAGAEIEGTVDRAMCIFRFLAAKDTFEAFFKKDLAKRLLLQSGTSVDTEVLVVQKLRDECGGGYTSKLEGMFRDVELSKGLLAEFRARPEVRALLEEQPAAGGGSAAAGAGSSRRCAAASSSQSPSCTGAGSAAFDFGVTVVTTGLWPTQPSTPEIAYPPGLRKLQESFAVYYADRFTGRSLRWSPLLGHCILRANYEGGVRKELVVSVFQALVCLLFNGRTSLTSGEIASATKIPQADLHRTLQSLALHKYVKVLVKEPKSREVAESDVFSVNAGFVSYKSHRVLVPQISAKDQHEEEAAVEQRVFEDRQHEVDAAVVRIMKVKKRLTHQQLVAEVFTAISFPVQAADVKARVDSLIEREYLERDPKDPASYSYMA